MMLFLPMMVVLPGLPRQNATTGGLTFRNAACYVPGNTRHLSLPAAQGKQAEVYFRMTMAIPECNRC
ncbi:MAG: hypothetical protein IPP29_13425 [Bacteroidetes bacterium]|nr:hypothetical protein [Bacteroidota bacterium]